MWLGLLLVACDDGGTQDTGYDIDDNPCAEGLWPGDARFTVHRFSIDDIDHVPTAGLACRSADATHLQFTVSYGDDTVGVIELQAPALDETWTLGTDDVTVFVSKDLQSWDTDHFAGGGTLALESGFVDDVDGRLEADAASDSGVLRLTLDLHVDSPSAWSGSGSDSGLGSDTGGGFDTGGLSGE